MADLSSWLCGAVLLLIHLLSLALGTEANDTIWYRTEQCENCITNLVVQLMPEVAGSLD